jgi:hypothetical protein
MRFWISADATACRTPQDVIWWGQSPPVQKGYGWAQTQCSGERIGQSGTHGVKPGHIVELVPAGVDEDTRRQARSAIYDALDVGEIVRGDALDMLRETDRAESLALCDNCGGPVMGESPNCRVCGTTKKIKTQVQDFGYR